MECVKRRRRRRLKKWLYIYYDTLPKSTFIQFDLTKICYALFLPHSIDYEYCHLFRRPMTVSAIERLTHMDPMKRPA